MNKLWNDFQFLRRYLNKPCNAYKIGNTYFFDLDKDYYRALRLKLPKWAWKLAEWTAVKYK